MEPIKNWDKYIIKSNYLIIFYIIMDQILNDTFIHDNYNAGNSQGSVFDENFNLFN